MKTEAGRTCRTCLHIDRPLMWCRILKRKVDDTPCVYWELDRRSPDVEGNVYKKLE